MSAVIYVFVQLNRFYSTSTYLTFKIIVHT